MQPQHLKKVEKTDFLATFQSFKVGDSEFIPFSLSKAAIDTWRTLYYKFRKNGQLNGEFKLCASKSNGQVGTLIMRMS